MKRRKRLIRWDRVLYLAAIAATTWALLLDLALIPIGAVGEQATAILIEALPLAALWLAAWAAERRAERRWWRRQEWAWRQQRQTR